MVEPAEIKQSNNLINWNTVLTTKSDKEFVVTAIAKERCEFSIQVKYGVEE